MRVKYFILFIFLIAACGVERQYEDYRLQTTGDLILNQTNHKHGYGKGQCFMCHNVSNIHKVNTINAPNFDLAIPLVQQSGLSSCSGCHGTNGVP
ncbi:MAG: hypothetical protein IPM57_11230 [Oligoflexia bacterium]|nr:hypothetical protein [Oligoflexia bacterium]